MNTAQQLLCANSNTAQRLRSIPIFPVPERLDKYFAEAECIKHPEEYVNSLCASMLILEETPAVTLQALEKKKNEMRMETVRAYQ